MLHPASDVSELQQRIAELEATVAEQQERLVAVTNREARHRDIMDSNMVGILFWRIDGRIYEANDFVLNLTGYTRADLEAGRIDWSSMTPPEYLDRERRAFQQLAECGVCDPFEKEYIRKDGSRVAVLIGGAYSHGRTDRGVCYVLDASDRRKAESLLKASEQRFREFMNHSGAVAFIKDSAGRRVYTNRRYEEIFGQQGSTIGSPDGRFFSPEKVQHLRERDQRILASGKAERTVEELPIPGGEVHYWLTDCFRIEDAEGQELIGGVALDITTVKQTEEQLRQLNEQLELRVQERTAELSAANHELNLRVKELEQAQSALRKSENRYRRLTDQSVMATQVFSTDGKVSAVNRAWEQLWGLTLEDVSDYNVLEDPQLRDLGLMRNILRAFAGEASPVEEAPYVPPRGSRAGEECWSRAVAYPVKDETTGEVEEIVIVGHDITNEKRALQRLNQEERLLRKLFDLHEAERRLLAYEIHDGLVQEMVGVKLLVEAAKHQVESGGAGAIEMLTTACNVSRSTIVEARRLISGLRPLIIDERGIVDSIQYLIEEHLAMSPGYTIHFDHQVGFRRLVTLMETTVFRIIQESLANVRRHSGASHVAISLRQEDQRLSVSIRDNGCGFDLATIAGDHFGIDGIRKRAQIFGGWAKIITKPGQGTTIHVEVPLTEAQIADETAEGAPTADEPAIG